MTSIEDKKEQETLAYVEITKQRSYPMIESKVKFYCRPSKCKRKWTKICNSEGAKVPMMRMF